MPATTGRGFMALVSFGLVKLGRMRYTSRGSISFARRARGKDAKDD